MLTTEQKKNIISEKHNNKSLSATGKLMLRVICQVACNKVHLHLKIKVVR